MPGISKRRACSGTEKNVMNRRAAIAIAAHPDDIEFYMGGTLLLLEQAGYQTHCLNVACGNCGSAQHNAATTRKIRTREARAAARTLGATFHPPLANDLEIVYSVELLRAIAAVIRDVRPSIVLTHSPQDYMEDHMITCRLAVTAAFARGMPNFRTVPRRHASEYEVTVYHAMPHGLRDGLRRRVVPGIFVNTTTVHKTKLDALARHRSQQSWLHTSQGMNSYLRAMEHAALELGRLSKKFRFAEGWRRHLHLGFCAENADPLRDALGGNFLVNRSYERSLDR
jgi:LmbE family N-acetylglucosaminyl deacetylase